MQDEERTPLQHHGIIGGIECWRGVVEAGLRANFLGVKTRDYMARLEGRPEVPKAAEITTRPPPFDEEYFQWIDLAEAVSLAERRFTMMELGAGYGRWLANAATLLRKLSGKPYRLIGVEAEPTHFQWLLQHMQDNAVDSNSCHLIQAAVDAEDGARRFLVGRPSRWYGQSLWPPEAGMNLPPRLKWLVFRVSGMARLSEVKAVSLAGLLQPLDMVDLIDLDVQGSESRILSSARELLQMKVRRVHVGTHSRRNESELRELFRKMRWKCRFDYPRAITSETPYGKINFQDGVQSWINNSIL